MQGLNTIEELQAHIKAFDHRPEDKQLYFLKLIEEVGELAEMMRKDKRLEQTGQIKGTIEEELSDVLYYTLALANAYGINLREAFLAKDELNKVKWNRGK